MLFQTKCYFPDAYMPDTRDGISHETISVLNVGEKEAHVELTLYFEDREPMKGFSAVCGPNRTCHIRLDRIASQDGQPVPRCTPYAIAAQSSEPVLFQYTRLDATRPSYSLMTAMGAGEE